MTVPANMMMMPEQAAGEVEAVGAAEVAKPRGLNREMVQKKVMDSVRMIVTSDEEDLGMDSPLMEAGLDSLSSVELVTTLSREFQMAFSPSLMFDFPTAKQL